MRLALLWRRNYENNGAKTVRTEGIDRVAWRKNSETLHEQLVMAEDLGLGSRAYTLDDVFPVTEPDFKQVVYIQASPH